MGTTIPAKTPNAEILKRGLNTFARKATAVVDDVIAIALVALLNVYANLCFFELTIFGLTYLL